MMMHGAIVRFGGAVVLGSALLVVTACGGGEAANQQNARAVNVVARDISFAATDLTLMAGALVRLTLVNEGTAEHDFTVAGLTADGRVVDARDGHGAGHGMTTLAPGSVHASAQGGARATVTFIPKAGTYEFLCTVPGHREAGMRGTLTVK